MSFGHLKKQFLLMLLLGNLLTLNRYPSKPRPLESRRLSPRHAARNLGGRVPAIPAADLMGSEPLAYVHFSHEV